MAKGIVIIMKFSNPYLPLWEHVPDGEARVFDDPSFPGKKRLYVIGSHDVRRDSYCGADIRIWSAPTEDLSDWRDEGAVFTYQAPNGLWDVMFAPDLVEVKRRDGSKEYFLYPHSRGPGREALVCSGPTPTGPFTPLNVDEKGELLSGSFIGFDPSVYVEQIDDPNDPDYDIGFRAYVYYGFQNSFAAQLDQLTMWTVRPGTEIIEHFIPSSHSYGNLRDPVGTVYPHVMDETDLNCFNFFEASSIRKIGNKYILIFSGYSGPDYGLESTNSSLRYGYGDSPLGPWRSGGVLVDSRAPVLNCDGDALEIVNTWHNTHGGLEEVEGRWYCFYHRPPRGYGFTRQAMVAPVVIQWDETSVAEGGKVVINAYNPYAKDGIWTARATNGDEYTGAQVTSEGFSIYGLPLYDYYSAGIASYMSNTSSLSDNFDIWDNHMPIEKVQNGDRIGYLHFDFREVQLETKFNLWLIPTAISRFKIHVWLDGPWENAPWNGRKLGTIEVAEQSSLRVNKYVLNVSKIVSNLDKKHGIFLVAEGLDDDLFDLIGLGFSAKQELLRPVVPMVKIFADGKEVELPEHPTASTVENGITGYHIYDAWVMLPKETKERVQFSAKASDAIVKIEVKQPEEVFGTATVKFDYHGVVKTYYIHLTPHSNKGEEVEYFIARSHPVFENGARLSWNEEIADFNSKNGNSLVTITVDVAETGEYELGLTHHAMKESTTHLIKVNDNFETTFTYRTGGWLKSVVPEVVKLKKGENTIQIESLSGEAELRIITLCKFL